LGITPFGIALFIASCHRNWYTETGFIFVLPQLTVISTTETRFFFRGKETRDTETGFLFVLPQLTVISTAETRFLYAGIKKRSLQRSKMKIMYNRWLSLNIGVDDRR
jgi:hypothetical protein